MAGLFLLAMGYRLANWRGYATSAPVLAAVAAIAAVATVVVEVTWFATATGVDPMRILAANLDFSYSIRPVWWVLVAGLCLSLIPLVRRRDAVGSDRRRAPRRGVALSEEPG